MATETQRAPDVTIVNRIGSIPLVSSSLSSIHNTLSTSPYTSSPYATAQAVSLAALGTASKVSQRPMIASLVVRADGLANAAVDAVESRYPYPFKATPEEARDAATKTVETKVVQPAARVATDIDQRFTPLIDFLEAYLQKLANSPQPSSDRKATYQYQRALDLSRNVRDNLYAYSGSQYNALKEQNALVQRATDTAALLSQGAHVLSERMIAELQSIRNASAELPSHVQSSLHTLTQELGSTISELSSIVSDKELAAGEKVARVRHTVEERVKPVLEATTARLRAVLGSFTAKASESETEVARSARKHAEETRKAGATFADAARGEADAIASGKRRGSRKSSENAQ
jgi:ElaB/YqjD/DUF883 family membrane-anchored ribosome-binding protein